jgi:DNA-binding NarL/FixJ family response regulator
MSPADTAVCFLVVEDDSAVAMSYRRILSAYGDVRIVDTVATARQAIANGEATGLITDISLPDGSGLDVAREARGSAKNLPILIISGNVDQERLDAAYQLHAAFLLKPVGRRQLQVFAERAIQRQRRSATLILAWANRYKLSAAETVTLRLAIDGLRRDEIAAARGVSANTVKSQIGTLLSKVGAPTIDQAVALFYGELSMMT